MTNAPALLNHALRMLVHDPAVTLRILMPGLLLIVASSIGITYFMPGQMWSPTLTPDQVEMIEPSDAGGVLLAGLAGVVGYILTAVIWHRHVLLTGAARETPLFPGVGVMGSYLWRAIIVALVQIAAALPILAVTGLIATVVSLFLAGFLAGIIFFWLALRISLILPAAAMGRQMRIAESWQATAPLAGPLWGVAAMLSILSAVLALLIGMLTGTGTTADIALQNVSFIVEALISISVLTTLYGHLIEGRPLG